MRNWIQHKNFFLLCQGQLVSSAGDVLYEIALGFCLLQAYHSSALMATVVAVSAVPGLIAAPFAGVIIDRMNPKWILVTVDFIRGAAVTVTAVWTLCGGIPLWMFYLAGTAISVGGAFFTPCIRSLIPLIVEKKNLMRANSLINLANRLTQTGGNSAGGFLYGLFGAGPLFLLNGISFLFSGTLSFFLKVSPKNRKNRSCAPSFWADLKAGFEYTVRFAGLRDMILMACFLNFFASGAFILLQPLFLHTPGFGIQKYGIAAGAICVGNLLGMLFTSAARIPCRMRMVFFLLSAMVDAGLNALFPFADIHAGILLLFVAGVGNSVVNMLILTSVQQSTREAMRGKVFSLIAMGARGIAPLGIAAAGAAAEFLDLKYLIFSCNLIALMLFIFFAFQKPFRDFINFDPEISPRQD
ncbi:MAG: MFS transporter [Oscillospiraceae bacterium]|nr:MFS transporter [Oscillospiraceae bacterium]